MLQQRLAAQAQLQPIHSRSSSPAAAERERTFAIGDEVWVFETGNYHEATVKEVHADGSYTVEHRVTTASQMQIQREEG